MKSIDQVILQMKSNNSESQIIVNTMNYPRSKLRVSGYDVVAANGAVWYFILILYLINRFYIPPMVIFFILLTEIVMEKVLYNE
jgi:hypothetical protein